MSGLKKLLGDTALYGLSSIIGRVINFLLVPLYTKFFVPEQYGIVTELYTYVAFLNVVYMYGMETAYFRFATKHKDHADDIYATSVLSIFFTSVLFSTVFFVFASPIATILGYTGYEIYFKWLSIIIGIDAIMAIPFARLRLVGKASYFAVVKVINILLNVGLNIFFIVGCRLIYEGKILEGLKDIITIVYHPNWSVEYVFVSNLLANLALVPLLAPQLFKVKGGINKAFLYKMLPYAYPILFTGLAGITNEMLSRLLLRQWLPIGFYKETTSLAALGIFGACYKLAMFMQLGIQAFRYAAEPFFFSKAEDRNAPSVYADVMHAFILVASFVFVSVSLQLDFLGHLFLRNPVYHTGLHIVPFLLFGYLFLGIYYNLSIWFKLKDKTYVGTIISVSAALLTIFLNYIMIPLAGYLGSAMVTSFIYLIMAVGCYTWGKKQFPVPYKIWRGLFYLGFSVLIVYAFQMLELSYDWSKIALGALISVIYALVLFVFEFKKIQNS